MDKSALQLLTVRLGRTAVGAPTEHNMGAAGTLEAARGFLQELDVRGFRVNTKEAFLRISDAKTNDLAAPVPPSTRHKT